MDSFVLRQLLSTIPLLFLISICIFVIIEIAPGDPILRVVERPSRLSSEQIDNFRNQYGLNDPIPIRYLKWLKQAIKGDFGYSFTTRRPVTEEILDRLPHTILLVTTTLAIVIALSIPIGIISAVKQYTFFDIIVTTFVFIGQAMPVYWLGTILIYIFYILLKNPLSSEPLLPIGGISSWGDSFNILDRLKHLILPVTTLAFGWIAVYTRFLRASTLDVLSQDYVTLAYAKGISKQNVLLKHVFKNAALPMVTLLALDLPMLLAGALYVEIIFSWPGVGRLFYRAAQQRDYPLSLAITMMVAIAVVLCNFFADIIYAYIDPRIHFEK